MGFLRTITGAIASGWQAARLSMANRGLDAARHDDAWGFTPWVSLNVRDEVDEYDLATIWRRARELYHNCPPIRLTVSNMVNFTGSLRPLPATADEEWNELALSAFLARTKNKHLFDIAAQVNYRQALRFLERSAIIDGDCAIVPTYAEDGGASFAFYRAPKIAGGGIQGVETNAHNRPLAYFITDDAGNVSALPAHQVTLYRHDTDPTGLRGRSELIAALRHAHDLQQIVGYTKQGVKLAASMGLIMTKPQGDKAPTIGSAIGSASRKNIVNTAEGPKTLMGTGLEITSLPEGRDIKPITDNRPSTQVMAFVEHLVCCIAWASGLDPEILFYSNKMGSAATRFSLAKVKRWQRARLDDMEEVCNMIWRHTIACEIACGRLRPCREESWLNVRWIPERDMTIDIARESTAQINLSRELMADDDDFTLATTGKTVKQLARNKAANVAFMKQICAENGITMAELRQGMVGDTSPVPTPQPVPDDDPESPAPQTQHTHSEQQ